MSIKLSQVLLIFTYLTLVRTTTPPNSKPKLNSKANIKHHVYMNYDSFDQDALGFLLNSLRMMSMFSEFNNHLRVHLIPFSSQIMHIRKNQALFECNHGLEECKGNKVHACIITIYKHKYRGLLECAIKGLNDVEVLEAKPGLRYYTSALLCIKKLGVSRKELSRKLKFEGCFNDPRNTKHLFKQFKKQLLKNRKAKNSLVIDLKKQKNGALPDNLFEALCSKVGEKHPELCKNKKLKDKIEKMKKWKVLGTDHYSFQKEEKEHKNKEQMKEMKKKGFLKGDKAPKKMSIIETLKKLTHMNPKNQNSTKVSDFTRNGMKIHKEVHVFYIKQPNYAKPRKVVSIKLSIHKDLKNGIPGNFIPPFLSPFPRLRLIRNVFSQLQGARMNRQFGMPSMPIMHFGSNMLGAPHIMVIRMRRMKLNPLVSHTINLSSKSKRDYKRGYSDKKFERKQASHQLQSFLP